MNLWTKIKEFIAKLGLGSLEKLAYDAEENIIEDSLRQVQKDNPQLASAIVSTLSAWTPYLALAAAKTKGTFDDNQVIVLQEALADFAAKNNIPLLPFASTGSGGDHPKDPPQNP